MKFLLILPLLALVFGAWVRLAPSDPQRWHRMPTSVTNQDLAGGAMRIVDVGGGGFERLDTVIQETPRTKVLTGSVEDGMVTYVTRSAVFGFPDYTTIRKLGGQIQIHGRLRYGLHDTGVNAARIDAWLGVFGQRG